MYAWTYAVTIINLALYGGTLAARGIGALDAEGIQCKLRSPSSPNCAITGHFRRGHDPYPLASPQRVDSAEECAALCARRVYSVDHDQTYAPSEVNSYQEYCASFSFEKGTGLCYLYSYNAISHVEPSNHGPVYYDHTCFDCGRFCKQPYGAQLIDNGGFEEPDLGPWQADGLSIEPGRNSPRSVSCSKRYCDLEQEINMCKEETYIFQFDYQAITKGNEDLGLSLRVGADFDYSKPGGSSYTYRYSVGHQTKKAWTTVRGYYRYSAGPHFGPVFDIGNMYSNIFIDNVYMARTPSATSKAGAKSVLANAGFESGRLAPWKQKLGGFEIGGKFKIVSPGINSTYAAEWISSGEAWSSPTLHQTAPTKPNTAYRLIFDLKFKGKHAITVVVEELHEEENITSLASHYRNISPGNHTLSDVLFTSRNTTTLGISYTFPGRKFHASIVIDNIQLIEAEHSKYYP